MTKSEVDVHVFVHLRVGFFLLFFQCVLFLKFCHSSLAVGAARTWEKFEALLQASFWGLAHTCFQFKVIQMPAELSRSHWPEQRGAEYSLPGAEIQRNARRAAFQSSKPHGWSLKRSSADSPTLPWADATLAPVSGSRVSLPVSHWIKVSTSRLSYRECFSAPVLHSHWNISGKIWQLEWGWCQTERWNQLSSLGSRAGI